MFFMVWIWNLGNLQNMNILMFSPASPLFPVQHLGTHVYITFLVKSPPDLCSEKRGGAVRIRHKTLPRSSRFSSRFSSTKECAAGAGALLYYCAAFYSAFRHCFKQKRNIE